MTTVHDEDQDDAYGTPFDTQYIIEQEGRIEVGDDVIARIAGIASTEVTGVTLDSKFSLADLIGRKGEPVKGIVVERIPEENAVHIHCTVRIEYGQDMYETAVRFRHHIRSTIEKMTRLIVKGVDIKIVGITLAEKEERLEKVSTDKRLEADKKPEALLGPVQAATPETESAVEDDVDEKPEK
ncbi:MAG: Asp23/Gls24 family envelope stress response protein [Sumerlaeia bacterium]